ncbi:unnamed protein product [Mytilus edulis]|uniref:Globin domain-containing protein n=2 Tax=Mytilus TaxID=6548 RepID=A0A8S3UTP8_MYTED|nr:unnamed protein product [Mytilus edulis]
MRGIFDIGSLNDNLDKFLLRHILTIFQKQKAVMTENGTHNGVSNGTTSEPSALSEQELEAINETWTLIWNDKKNNGIELFIKLFTHFPESQNFFKDFKGLPIEEVREHKKLRAHALSVMYALKSFIDNLDDEETLDALVRKNAQNHAERGVGEREVKMLLPAFLELLNEQLQEKTTDLHKSAWTKLFGVIALVAREEQNHLK